MVALGASQGAASVIMAAGSDPEIDGVIASAPYRNMQDLVDAGQMVFGYPHWFGRIVTLVSNWRLGLVDRDGSWTIVGEPPVLSPIAAVSRISPRPLLLMHGTSDTVISFHASEDLFIHARDPKSLWLVPAANHEDFERKSPQEFTEHVSGFLQKFFPLAEFNQLN